MREQLMTATEARKHYDRVNNDARMRMLAQSCVAFAMNEYGPVDPNHADRDAHDIASLAAHLLVSRIYTEDVELRALKEDNERLQRLAHETLMSVPSRIAIDRITNP